MEQQSSVAYARENYRVTYGTRAQGQLGYILLDRGVTPATVVFQSDFKSEVITESQMAKGFDPVDGSEVTYAQQIAAVNGENVLTEMSDLRRQLTLATEAALTEYLVNMAGQDWPDDQIALDQYTFDVESGGSSAVRVTAMRDDNSTPLFMFTLNISGKPIMPSVEPLHVA